MNMVILSAYSYCNMYKNEPNAAQETNATPKIRHSITLNLELFRSNLCKKALELLEYHIHKHEDYHNSLCIHSERHKFHDTTTQKV